MIHKKCATIVCENSLWCGGCQQDKESWGRCCEPEGEDLNEDAADARANDAPKIESRVQPRVINH